MKPFVAYYRVSTHHQGINGLGMEAQRESVQRFLTLGGHSLIAEFAEVESGKRNDRQELKKAIECCRQHKAKLLIAKLDRLARNAAFLFNLRDSGCEFVAVDLPHADSFTVGILALLAEKERDMIAERTKAGLAAAMRRGVKLGNPQIAKARQIAVEVNRKQADAFAGELKPIIMGIRKAGMNSLREIAFCLNARGFKTPNGKAFQPQSVKNLLNRISASEATEIACSE